MDRTALLLLALATACGAPDAPTPVVDTVPPPPPADPIVRAWSNAKGLIGEWKNTLDTGDTLSYEQWTASADSISLVGKGFVLAGKDTVFIEDLRLASADGTLRYSARISTQNDGEWVDFIIEPGHGDTLVFANATHDFPTYIRYWKDRDGSWDVLVANATRSFPLKYAPRRE